MRLFLKGTCFVRDGQQLMVVQLYGNIKGSRNKDTPKRTGTQPVLPGLHRAPPRSKHQRRPSTPCTSSTGCRQPTFTRIICMTTAQLLPNVLHHHRNTQLERVVPPWPYVARNKTPQFWAAIPDSLDRTLTEQTTLALSPPAHTAQRLALCVQPAAQGPAPGSCLLPCWCPQKSPSQPEGRVPQGR